VTASHLADPNGDVTQVSESLHPGIRFRKKSEAAHGIQVGYEPAHTRSSIARRSPLACRVHYIHLPYKRQILGTLPILISMMTGDRVHYILEHLWLQAFILKKSFI